MAASGRVLAGPSNSSTHVCDVGRGDGDVDGELDEPPHRQSQCRSSAPGGPPDRAPESRIRLYSGKPVFATMTCPAAIVGLCSALFFRSQSDGITNHVPMWNRKCGRGCGLIAGVVERSRRSAAEAGSGKRFGKSADGRRPSKLAVCYGGGGFRAPTSRTGQSGQGVLRLLGVFGSPVSSRHRRRCRWR